MGEEAHGEDRTQVAEPVVNKHQLFVAQTPGFGPSTHVFFQCRNCVANVHIERSVMQQLLSGKKSSISSDIIIWGNCHGA